MTLSLRWADLSDPVDQGLVTQLTNIYAQDPNALGTSLPDDVLAAMPAFIAEHPAVRVALAFDGEDAVGLATCVLSVSTFAAKPILNIHDIVVRPEWRGGGVGTALINEVDAEAQRLGCCKVSLEVADGNPARRLYEREGFVASGTFMTKEIT